ncbi:hypothetical protein [Arthrobacter sp. E3]|uniref:hypothetical protein n=1 Tax=Arthrobacter sp. E3 TaxID=517402 RepID=UPI001A948EB8|nr:hypothetical protein [Arthrobacter sp. E3]
MRRWLWLAQSAPVATQASAPDVAAATGKSVKGSGYTFIAPTGWAEPKDAEAQQGIDTFVADMTDTDGFADNVNVLLSPAGEVTPERVETQGVKELRDAGTTDVTTRDRTTIAGSESAHLSAIFPHDTGQYQVDQFYVTHDKQTYIMTFSFSTTVSEADRDALCSSVLQTWAWA